MIKEQLMNEHQLIEKLTYSEPTVVKIDISKFFYTIDRMILIEILYNDLGTINSELLHILATIIASTPKNHTVSNGDTHGLPLGNLTSQLFANVLMNKVDQFVKNTLKVRYYLRYADDLFFIVDGKERAKEVLNETRNFIETELKLICNPKKTGIYPLHRGIDGLGFVTSGSGIKITKRTKESIRKLMKEINNDYSKNKIDYNFRERQLYSYKSFISVCGNSNYMDQIITMNPITYITKSKKNPNGTSYKIERKYDKNGRLILNHSAYLSSINIEDDFLPPLFD